MIGAQEAIMQDMRDGNCPSCQHDEIVEGVPAEFSTDLNNELPAAFAYELQKLFFGGEKLGGCAAW
jgi:hypothetical protein